MQSFHFAFPVDDITAARKFYGDILGCPEGRSSDVWADFDFFGHQIVAHLQSSTEKEASFSSIAHGKVDGYDVPLPHFGVVLDMEQWRLLAEKLKALGVTFIVEPYVRFGGASGEQATMLFLDPAGNALEFKAFSDRSQLFKSSVVASF